MERIGILGAGNMGAALAAGLNENCPELRLSFFDTDREKAQQTASSYGADTAGSAAELVEQSDRVIIAVKPQHLGQLFDDLAGAPAEKHYISIVAGIPSSRFREQLSTSQVIRFMPNLAANVGAAAVAVAAPEGVKEDFRRDALTIARALGSPLELPEELLAAFTGLSGSGIAYVFAFIHALALGGTEAGIAYGSSLDIALSTVEGAAKLLRSSGTSPAEYLTRVTSAGGTTIAGVRALEEGGLTPAVMNAVARAKERAEEIEKGE
jgi:pyrroline-5-carboxylate reductase